MLVDCLEGSFVHLHVIKTQSMMCLVAMHSNALHFAASNGEPKEVETLISSGYFDVDTQDSWGHTPLQYSAYADRENTARVLLKWGADVGIKAYKGVARNKRPLEFCRSKKQRWCQILGFDGLEQSYTSLSTARSKTKKDQTCSSAGDCPSYTQGQLQQIMKIVGENEEKDFCQFYNVTCQAGTCGIGLTWNSFACIPDCQKYPPAVQFPACPCSCPLKCPCGCHLTKDGVIGREPFSHSAIAGTGILRSVLKLTGFCPTTLPCKVRGRCCRVVVNYRGEFRGCPSRC